MDVEVQLKKYTSQWDLNITIIIQLYSLDIIQFVCTLLKENIDTVLQGNLKKSINETRFQSSIFKKYIIQLRNDTKNKYFETKTF